MNPRRIQYHTFLCSPHRRRSILALILFIFFLICHIPHPSAIKNNPRASRPPPKHRVDEQPHFLYRSPFRQNPDLEYEKRLSSALQKFEQEVLARDGGSNIAENRIWQIAQDEDHRGSDSISFEQRNKDWTYTLVSDARALEFVTSELSAIPEIASVYKSYPHNVLRADLLRYLLLWYYGGFYADTDMIPAKPIKECPALQPVFASTSDSDRVPTIPREVSLVVGVEIDEPYATRQFMRDWRWTRRYGVLQYTMYAPRRFSPLLREIIVRAVSHTRQHESKYWGLFRGLRYTQKAILMVTGPDIVTDTILDTLSSSLPSTHPLVEESVSADVETGDLVLQETGETQKRVTWAPFYRLRDTLCIGADEAKPTAPMGGLCVLPVSAWGNGQRHSQAEGFDGPQACLNHRFRGRWKKGWWEHIFG
ncbi:nucleotide-diphospho-sugar transferase [Aspergillus floccosus]